MIDSIVKYFAFYHIEDIFQFGEKITVLVAMAYMLSRGRIFSHLLQYKTSRKEKIWLLTFFSVLGLIEFLVPADKSPFVLPWNKSPLDIRILAAASAGLLSGMWLGVGTGVITAVATLLIQKTGGISPISPVYADGIAAILAGAAGGYIYNYRSTKKGKVAAGFLIGASAQILKLAMSLAFLQASISVTAIISSYIGAIIVNGAMVALFMLVVGDIGTQHEKIGRIQINTALEIANKTLPHIRPGLNEESAKQIARIILDIAEIDAVAITNTERVLAYAGAASDHHKEDREILLAATKDAIRTGDITVADTREKLGCTHPGCILTSAVVAPLFYQDKTIGAVELYQTEERTMSEDIIELAFGFAQFLSRYQMESAELQRQTKAASEARLRALQAQIHPHFLFNTLNTIAALCRFDPSSAESLTIQLGSFFRSTLRKDIGIMCALSDELKTIDTYIGIEKARFGDRLNVYKEIDPDSMKVKIPYFIVQPIVENAILHGLSQKTDLGQLKLISRVKNNTLSMWIIDNGVGISKSRLHSVFSPDGIESHGMYMLHERLKSIYGKKGHLRIISKEGIGTAVVIAVPLDGF